MMTKKKNSIRKNIYIPAFVDDWLKEVAEKRGISQSIVISLALQEQMKQEKALESISNMDRLIKEVKKLKEG